MNAVQNFNRESAESTLWNSFRKLIWPFKNWPLKTDLPFKNWMRQEARSRRVPRTKAGPKK